jgi:hypothetical protein
MIAKTQLASVILILFFIAFGIVSAQDDVLIEGKWYVDWEDNEMECENGYSIATTDRNFILTTFAETGVFITDDVFTWPPLEFAMSDKGYYLYLRRVLFDDGDGFDTITYKTIIQSSTHITGIVIVNYPSQGDCLKTDRFEMTLVDSDIICMVGGRDGTRTYTDPGANYDLVETLRGSTRYDVTGQAADANGTIWLQLANGSWVRSTRVFTAGHCEDVPEVSP